MDRAITDLKANSIALTPMMDQWERTELPAFRNASIDGEFANPSVPKVIQWRNRYDMDAGLAAGVHLIDLGVSSKNLERTTRIHSALGIKVNLAASTSDALSVRLKGPTGTTVTLTSD